MLYAYINRDITYHLFTNTMQPMLYMYTVYCVRMYTLYLNDVFTMKVHPLSYGNDVLYVYHIILQCKTHCVNGIVMYNIYVTMHMTHMCNIYWII